MNQIKVGGGASASPIVKAVLDNIGRRYLVEHTEADDGSWWADRYSDGWVEQGGKTTATSNKWTEVPLPIALTSLFAGEMHCASTEKGANAAIWTHSTTPSFSLNSDKTAIAYYLSTAGNAVTNNPWILTVSGYAA